MTLSSHYIYILLSIRTKGNCTNSKVGIWYMRLCIYPLGKGNYPCGFEHRDDVKQLRSLVSGHS